MSNTEDPSAPRITPFDDVPKIRSSREYKSNYDFSKLQPKEMILVEVTVRKGASLEAKASKIRTSLYSAFYRFMKKNPDARAWKRSIRVGNDESGKPINVGFYRIS